MKNRYLLVITLTILVVSALYIANEYGSQVSTLRINTSKNIDNSIIDYNSQRSLNPLWSAEISGASILDAFYGDFYQLDRTTEIAVALDNSTVVVYNYTNKDQVGTRIGSFGFNISQPDTVVITTHFVFIDSTNGATIFANITGNLTLPGIKSFLGYKVGDLDLNGYDDLIVWNKTDLVVYLDYPNTIVTKWIKPSDLQFTNSGSFVMTGYFIDVIDVNSGRLFAIPAINGTNVFVSLLKVNLTTIVFNNLATSITHDGVTSIFYDFFVFDAKWEDDYVEVGIEYLTTNHITTFFSYNKSFKEFNTTKSYIPLNSYTLTSTPERSFWVTLDDYNTSLSYGQYAIRRISLGKPSYYTLIVYFFDRSINRINKVYVSGFYMPRNFAIGNTDYKHKDLVDDIILPYWGEKFVDVVPGYVLRLGKSSYHRAYTSAQVYDVETLDIPTKTEDLVVTGEKGYVMVYFTPDFYVTYFDGTPKGPVYKLKKYNITGDSVLDFLVLYTDPATGTDYVYVFLSDGEPPVIQRIEISPPHPTSSDYITVKVWATDNIGIYHMVGFFSSYMFDQKHLEYLVFFTKSSDGGYYYAQLQPLEIFPVLADYNASILIYARDLFGNQVIDYYPIEIYSSLDVDSYIPIFTPYNKAIKINFMWSYDGDRDGKDEAYIIATVNASPPRGDVLYSFIDYSSTIPYNYSIDVNSSIYGRPVGGGVALLSTGNIVVIIVSEKFIEVYNENLNLLWYSKSLTVDATNARVSDFDMDGADELAVSFANNTVKLYDVYLTNLTEIASFTLNGTVGDILAYNNYVYILKKNSTGIYLVVHSGNALIKEIFLNNTYMAYTKNSRVFATVSNKVVTVLSNGTIFVFQGANLTKINTGTSFSPLNFTESFITDGEYLYLADDTGSIYMYNSSIDLVYQAKATYGSVPFSLALGRLDNETQKELIVVYLEKFLNFFNIDANISKYLQIYDVFYILGGDFDNYTEYEALLIFDQGVLFIHDIYKYYGMYPIITGLQSSYVQGQQITAYVEITNIFNESVIDASVKAILQTPDGRHLVYTFVNLGSGIYKVNISTQGLIYGYYNLSISVQHDYYRDYTFNYTILLRPIIEIEAQFEYYARHGDSFVARFFIFDEYDNLLLNATGNVTIGTNLSARIYYNATSGFYEAKFNKSDLYSLPMDIYNLTFYADHPWALFPRIFVSKLYLLSQLKLNVTVNPRVITQGDNFTVTVHVFDSANFSVEFAYAEVSTWYSYDSGYTDSSGVYSVIISTIFWEAGNFTIDIYVDHYLATKPVLDETFVMILAVPSLYVWFDYKGPGVDIVYIDLVDRYDYILADGVMVMEVEGKNFTLNDTGSFRFDFNFTKVAPKTNFTVYFYVVNGTYTPDTKFGPYYIDVLVGGSISVSVKNALQSSPYIYQGDPVNITVRVVDNFGNPINDSGGYVYIGGQQYWLSPLSDGYYYTIVDTYLWSYGAYSFQVEVYWYRFYQGFLSYRGEFVILPYITISYSYEAYANSMTNLTVYFYDLYGYPLLNATIENITSPMKIVSNSTSFNQYTFLLNGSDLVPDYYWIYLNVSWSGGVWGVSWDEFAINDVPIRAQVSLEYVFTPNASGVYVQGESFQLNVILRTKYGVVVDNAMVTFGWQGAIKIAQQSNGVYFDVFDTTGLKYGYHSISIYVYHDLLTGELSKIVYLKLLANPTVEMSSVEQFGNKLVTVRFRVLDKYGTPIENATLEVSYINKTITLDVSEGVAIGTFNFSGFPLGKYSLTINVKGDFNIIRQYQFEITVKSLITPSNVKVEAFGLVTNETGFYPPNSIVQGEMLYINVTVFDTDGMVIPQVNLRIIFAGSTYLPTSVVNGTYVFQITTENMASGHYTAILQISGRTIFTEDGGVLSIEEMIYIKPEIHYKVELPEQIIEGQTFNVTVYLRDKYNNPLDPIGNKTKVIVSVGNREYEAKYIPESKAFVATVVAPHVSEDEVFHSFDVSVFIDYEGIGKQNAITAKSQLIVQATPPVTQSAIEENINLIWIMTAIATAVTLFMYLLVRYQAFNERLMKLLYLVNMAGTVGFFAASIGLYVIHEYGYSEIAALLSFMGIFPWYGLQIRMDQIKMFKVSYKSLFEEKSPTVSFNKINYLIIYLFGAVTIFFAFEIVGAEILWFSRYVLAGLRLPIGIHYITAQTLVFYLFAARGIYIKTIKHLKETAEKRIPSIHYASTLEDRMNLFTGIVEDSIKITGSYVLTTTVYTLYLLGTSIWGTSRLPALGLSPLTLGLILVPATIPIAIVWLLQYIKLPGEATVERIRFEDIEIESKRDLGGDIEIIDDLSDET